MSISSIPVSFPWQFFLPCVCIALMTTPFNPQQQLCLLPLKSLPWIQPSAFEAGILYLYTSTEEFIWELQKLLHTTETATIIRFSDERGKKFLLPCSHVLYLNRICMFGLQSSRHKYTLQCAQSIFTHSKERR